MNANPMNWEQAVRWLREQPEQQALVRDCYYDDPLLQVAQRFFKSDEWSETRELLPKMLGSALDLGAGRGISSYALSEDGWKVTALEPDPSLLVGAGAIRNLSLQANLSINVVEEYGESLPFEPNSFDLVYGRQVLHHAQDLPQLCQEVSRVLKPGGWFVAVREHVISRKEDISQFLEKHPLHRLYGGENAYLLQEYRQALRGSGMYIQHQLGPLESVINYFPLTNKQRRDLCLKPIVRIIGSRVTDIIIPSEARVSNWVLAQLSHLHAILSHTPGRLYSFVARKL